MLKQRLITAAILLPLVILGVLYLPNHYFSLLLALIVLVGADEMARLGGLNTMLHRLAYIGGVALLLAISELLKTDPLFPILYGAMAVWWVFVTTLFLTNGWHPKSYQGVAPVALFLGGLILVMAWAAMSQLHGYGESGPRLVLFLMVLIWVADSGAYFAGRKWGKTKLAPEISPGKTREGAYGALAGSVVCGVLLLQSGMLTLPVAGLILLCLLTTLVSIGGDLWESLIKRQRGVKDSGTLLPGHGGVLDRIDSLLSASPFFLIGLQLLEASS